MTDDRIHYCSGCDNSPCSSYLEQLGERILTINRANGFGEMTPADWDGNKWLIPGVLALIHSEVSEALEEFRKGHDKIKFGEELADILIRTLDCAAALEIDLDWVVMQKLKKNSKRGFKHGGRLI